MSHNGGWFAVSRLIFDHPVVGIHDREFTELEAWLWLLAEAAFEPQKVNNMGTIIVLDPGQIMHARRYLAQRWQWSEDKVRWFLKRLQNEAMIARYTTQQSAGKRTNKIQILTISNYSQYQFSQANQKEASPPPSHPASTQPAPSEPPANTPKITTQHLDNRSPPFPPDGGSVPGEGAVEARKAQRARARADEARKRLSEAQEAVGIYNKAAEKFGFRLCARVTPSRITRLAKRLDDIGGVEKFREALWAVVRNDFLMGRIVRRGEQPFKLDIDRLMQTDGNMGDVLANLLDSASDLNARKTEGEMRPDWWRDDPNAARLLPAEWWRLVIARYANGMWPVQFLGPGPWDHQNCLVPSSLSAELHLSAKYPSSDGRCVEH